MPSISCWRSAITAIINCKRWISTAEVFLQRKLKKFRLSASEEEPKSRHLMNIFKCVSLSRRICFCPLSMRVGSAFQFGFSQSKPCFLLKNRPWNSCYTEDNPISTWHFSYRWIKESEPAVIVWFLSSFSCGRQYNVYNVTHPVSNPARPRLKLTRVVLNWVLAIARRCCTNSLVINSDKTKLLVIGVPQITRSLPFFPVVKLLGKEIKPVPVVKDLSVIIDSSLSYNEHVTKALSHCMHRLIRINRI